MLQRQCRFWYRIMGGARCERVHRQDEVKQSLVHVHLDIARHVATSKVHARSRDLLYIYNSNILYIIYVIILYYIYIYLGYLKLLYHTVPIFVRFISTDVLASTSRQNRTSSMQIQSISLPSWVTASMCNIALHHLYVSLHF